MDEKGDIKKADADTVCEIYIFYLTSENTYSRNHTPKQAVKFENPSGHSQSKHQTASMQGKVRNAYGLLKIS